MIRRLIWLCVLCLLVTPRLARAQQVGAVDYSRLAHPDVAERLSLSDEQRVEVQRLLTARAMSLATTANDKRAEVMSNTDRELKALLTAEQVNKFGSLGRIHKIRFRFDNQPWLQVLEWFAEQSELTLVYDELPKRPFNFRDEREYSVREAMDLLNSVLLSKGFTMIRRQKLLMVVKLTGGLPTDLIPEIDVDRLEEFGQFEFVRTKLPIGGRVMEAVTAEMAPFLSTRGKAVPMKSTRQIAITETAGKVRAIQALISSIPEPKKKATPKPAAKKTTPKPKPAPKPKVKTTFVSHKVERLDLEKALETLKMMVPKAKLVADRKASEIQSLALETEQTYIRSLLDKMMENSAPENAPKVKTFTVNDTPNENLVNQLKLIAPGGEFSVDPETRRVVALARPDELEIVSSFMEQLGADGATMASKKNVKVFKLQESEPSGILAILNSMFPRAEIAADVAARTIVARGSDSELESIKDVVSNLDISNDQAKVSLKTFVLRSPGTYSAITATLASVAPEANVHWNPTTRQLFVLANDRDQRVVAEAIAGILQSSRTQQDSIRVHPLNDQQYGLLAEWQSKNVPEATVRWESDQQRIVVSASDVDQERVAGFVSNLQKLELGSNKPTVKSHTIERKESYELISRIYKSVAPRATLHWNERSKRLVVVATPREHLRIAELIESVQVATPEKPQSTIVAHEITRSKFDLLQSLLRESAPDARVSWDDRLKRMISIAEPAEQLKIQALLNSAAGIDDSDAKPTIETYRFPPRLQRRITLLVESLQQEFSDLSIVDEENVGELVVKGRVEAHQQLRQDVDSVVKDFSAQPRLRVKVFPLDHSEADPLRELLAELFPDTRIRADSAGNRIMAWGTDETLTNISQVIEQTDVEDVRGRQELVGYDVGKTRVSTLIKSLAERFPNMIMNSDYNTNRLMAWGTEKEHEELAKVVQQYRQVETPKGSMRVFKARDLPSLDLARMLESVVPNAKIVADRSSSTITVWGTDEEIALVAKAVDGARNGPGKQRIEYYDVPRGYDDEAEDLLQQTLYGLAIETTNDDRLLVLADDETHQRVKEILASLTTSSMKGKEGQTLKSYDVGSTNLTYLTNALAPSFPQMEFSSDRSYNRLMAWGSEEDHKRLNELLVSYRQSMEKKGELKVLSAKGLGADQLYTLLNNVAPKAKLTPNYDNNTLAVWADAATHEKIQATLKGLEVAPDNSRSVKVYQSPEGYADILTSLIASSVPQAAVQLQPLDNRLIVNATASDHEQVTKIVESVKSEGGSNHRGPKVYELKTSITPTVLATIQSAMPNAVLTLDEPNRRVVAMASEAEHERIAEMLTVLNGTGGDSETTLKTLPLKNPLDSLVLQSLQAAFPAANIEYDSENRQVVAIARPTDHDRLRAMIEQLQGSVASGKRYARTYASPDMSGTTTYQILTALVESDGKNRMTLNPENDSVVLFANEQGHEKAAEILEGVAASSTGEKVARTSTSFSLDQTDGPSVVSILDSLFLYDRRPPLLQFDESSNQLLVVGTKEQTEEVKKTVESLRSPEREIEVFSLRNNDAFDVESSIEELFSDMPEKSAPAVDASFEMQQLIVQATPSQMERIRKLLTKLGERLDRDGPGAGSNSKVRVVPFYGDSASILENVERMWPQLHKNELKIIYPGDETRIKMVSPEVPMEVPRPAGDSSDKPQAPQSSKPTADRPPLNASSWLRLHPLVGLTGVVQVEDESVESLLGDTKESRPEEIAPALQSELLVPEVTPKPSTAKYEGRLWQYSGPQEAGQGAGTEERGQEGANEAPSQGAIKPKPNVGGDGKPKATPPVVIIPGENELTLVCSDPEVLDALESMIDNMDTYDFRSASSRMGVYGLRNADAGRVTQILQNLFKEITFPGRTGEIIITADTRLNVVIVHANSFGQRMVEDLLRVLDTRENIDRLRLNAPQVVRLENTSVNRVLKILESVYKTQLAAGGAQKKVQIPKGVAANVAQVLEQINAKTSGPLLTLTKDEATNSIFVLGPDSLTSEVVLFIKKLDKEAVENSSRGVRVISLKSLRSETLQELLNELIQD